MANLTPTFTPTLPEWRGNTSSAEMNQNFQEILYDLNTIFSEASQIVVDINDLESKIRHEIEAVKNRIYSISGMITASDQTLNGTKMFYEDFYLPDQVIYPTNLTDEYKCSVSTEYGVATLPVNNSFSKVYTINITDGKTIVAPDLDVVVTPIDEDAYVKIEGTSETRAFDGNDDTVWERRVRFNRDSTKNNVTCLMTVTLPSMNNPYVNKFHIKPYPEGTTDVTMVTYDTTVAQDIVLPSFPVEGENNMNTTMWSFNNIQPTTFKIYFRQRSNKIEDDYLTFVYGAKEIGIEKVEYKTSGKVGIKFSLPSYETGLINKLTSFTTDPAYDNITYKGSIYTSQAEFDADMPVWTTSNSPITITNQLDLLSYGLSSLWVMVELVQSSGDTRTPILRSVSMTYTTTA